MDPWLADHVLRPPEPEEAPGQPWEPPAGSVRAEVLALYRRWAEVEAQLRRTWQGRLVLRLAAFRARFRR